MIDVAFIPSELDSAEVAVVVDVLRATTTVAAALAAGHERVLCCQDVETAERLRAPGRLLAGERECVAIPGFDRGNSPLGFEDTGTGDIVLSTTNGSRAIVAAADRSDDVVLASLAGIWASRRPQGPGAIRFMAGLAVLLAGLWMMATHLPLVFEAMRDEAPWPATIYHTSSALAVFGLGLLWATVTWSEAGDEVEPAPKAEK